MSYAPDGGSQNRRRQSSVETYRRRLSTIATPGQRSGDRFWTKCAMVCCTGCMSCWALVYLPAGAVLMSQTDAMDPATDFAHLASGCKITEEMHSQQDYAGQCLDRYTYNFVVQPPHASDWAEVYSSQTIKIVRCDCTCDDGNEEVEWFKYAKNEVLDCWVPDAKPISGHYTCPNEACVKLVDPAKEADERSGAAVTILSSGIIMFVLSCACCWLGPVYLRKVAECEKAKLEAAGVPVNMPNEPSGAAHDSALMKTSGPLNVA